MTTTLTEKIKVVIADDHGILRSGLRMLIDAQPDMKVIAEASKVSDISTVLTNTTTDVLVLDVVMPGGSGVQALRQLRVSFPRIRVVILTMHDDVALARSALAAGASAFVVKHAAHCELLSAIRAAHTGSIFVASSVAKAVISLQMDGSKSGNSRLLSDREEQVLQLVAQGYTNHEIAKRAYISTKTVETYRARITDKLGLRTRAEITRYALATGLLRTEDVLESRAA